MTDTQLMTEMIKILETTSNGCLLKSELVEKMMLNFPGLIEKEVNDLISSLTTSECRLVNEKGEDWLCLPPKNAVKLPPNQNPYKN